MSHVAVWAKKRHADIRHVELRKYVDYYNDGTISVFKKDGVTVYKEEDVLITCKGEPILIGVSLATYVGCRRVVLLPKRRHSVSCRQHVADMFQSCRRHKKMSCRQGVQNDTTFDDMSGDSRHVGNFVIVV